MWAAVPAPAEGELGLEGATELGLLTEPWVNERYLIDYQRGENDRALEQMRHALAISREIGDRDSEGNSLGSLGLAYQVLGQVERAIERYEQALAIAREIGNRSSEGNWLGNLGSAYSALGEVEQALRCHRQALAIARERGDQRIGDAHPTRVGVARRRQPDPPRAWCSAGTEEA